MSRVFARFCMTAALPEAAGDSPETGIIFEEVIQKINFPVMVTDHRGMPLAWKGIPVEPMSLSEDDYLRWQNLSTKDRLYPLKKALQDLSQENQPIPLMLGTDSTVVGYVYYGQPRVLKELHYLPFLQLAMIALFVGIGFMGFRAIKMNEERALWVGLTREAAHQLGTPISSLIGWITLLKEGSQPLGEVIPEMENDLAHLEKVLSRFNQIGSFPKLETQFLQPLLDETICYFERRLRVRGQAVTLERKIDPACRANLNRVLLSWAIENVVKNALDALEDRPGVIEISCLRNGRRIEIKISDNGRGIPPKNQKRIFAPGFTTKPMGWGLGLSLVKRIVEDYHGGRVRLLFSRPGTGTCFLIQLPAADQD